MNKVRSVLLVLSIFTIVECHAQKNEVKNIKEVITSFAEAGDKNDGAALESILDDNYRVLMNQLFGSESISAMDKATYIEKIESKAFGGDTREIKIKKVIVNDNNASASVTFKGTKMTVVSILLLVKNKDGVWKLASDTPSVKG